MLFDNSNVIISASFSKSDRKCSGCHDSCSNRTGSGSSASGGALIGKNYNKSKYKSMEDCDFSTSIITRTEF